MDIFCSHKIGECVVNYGGEKVPVFIGPKWKIEPSKTSVV